MGQFIYAHKVTQYSHSNIRSLTLTFKENTQHYVSNRKKYRCTYHYNHPQYGTPIDVILCFTMRFFYSETSIKIGHVNETSILLKFLFDHLTKDTSSC